MLPVSTGTCRTARLAIPLAALVLLLSGCGLIGGDDDERGDASGEQAEPANAGAVEPGEQEARETLASQDINALSVDLHVAVHDLVRGEETVELTFSVTNMDDESSDIRSNWLGAGGENNISGVRLIDPQNGTAHLVARDSDDNCVCSRYGVGDTYSSGESIFYSGTFGAPPDDVEEMDVQIPNAGTFNNVPLS